MAVTVGAGGEVGVIAPARDRSVALGMYDFFVTGVGSRDRVMTSGCDCPAAP